jgi:hypothetical protein
MSVRSAGPDPFTRREIAICGPHNLIHRHLSSGASLMYGCRFMDFEGRFSYPFHDPYAAKHFSRLIFGEEKSWRHMDHGGDNPSTLSQSYRGLFFSKRIGALGEYYVLYRSLCNIPNSGFCPTPTQFAQYKKPPIKFKVVRGSLSFVTRQSALLLRKMPCRKSACIQYAFHIVCGHNRQSTSL